MPDVISINIQNLCQICSGPKGSCTGNINQHLNSAGRCQFTTVNYGSERFNLQKTERSRVFFPCFRPICVRVGRKKALLSRTSRTTLQYGEHCRSITPPDRKHSEEFIHELMQQHISSVYNTALRENHLKCYPPKKIIHTQFRDRDVCVVSEWQFWMGFKTYSNRLELLLPLLTLTPAVSFPARLNKQIALQGCRHLQFLYLKPAQTPTAAPLSRTGIHLPLQS